jgi:hypothetical protein
MDYKKTEYKFLKTTDSETADKLRTLGFTELTQQDNGVFCFINDGKKLTFDAEKYECVYTNLLCL